MYSYHLYTIILLHRQDAREKSKDFENFRKLAGFSLKTAFLTLKILTKNQPP